MVANIVWDAQQTRVMKCGRRGSGVGSHLEVLSSPSSLAHARACQAHCKIRSEQADVVFFPPDLSPMQFQRLRDVGASALDMDPLGNMFKGAQHWGILGEKVLKVFAQCSVLMRHISLRLLGSPWISAAALLSLLDFEDTGQV